MKTWTRKKKHKGILTSKNKSRVKVKQIQENEKILQ